MFSNFAVYKMQLEWKKQELEQELMRQEDRDSQTLHRDALSSRSQFVRNVAVDPDSSLEHPLHKDPSGPAVANAPHEQDPEYHEERDLKTREPPVTKGTYADDDENNPDLLNPEKLESEEMSRERLGNPEEAGYKTILFWNTFFHSDDFRFGVGHQPFIEHKCPVHQCITTMDKKKLSQADLVMFHGPRIENFPPPKPRPKGQVYAYVQQEPHYAMSLEELPKYNGHFNLTITNRRDSDIWIPYAKVNYDPARVNKKPTMVDPRDRPRSIVWVVSHCSTPGKREWYVQELQKYIDIDVYGDCGDMECSKDDTWFCYEKFEREYRFYMALENNYCKDYVSEKVFRPMAYNMVPIVFGGANYTHFTPPHSVIDITEYSHPKDLAKYLHFLLNNQKAYNRYFAWKSHGYELDLSRKGIMGEAFCTVCEMLHDPNYKYKDYTNLKGWWTDEMCDAYTISRMRRKSKW